MDYQLYWPLHIYRHIFIQCIHIIKLSSAFTHPWGAVCLLMNKARNPILLPQDHRLLLFLLCGRRCKHRFAWKIPASWSENRCFLLMNRFWLANIVLLIHCFVLNSSDSVCFLLYLNEWGWFWHTFLSLLTECRMMRSVNYGRMSVSLNRGSARSAVPIRNNKSPEPGEYFFFCCLCKSVVVILVKLNKDHNCVCAFVSCMESVFSVPDRNEHSWKLFLF